MNPIEICIYLILAIANVFGSLHFVYGLGQMGYHKTSSAVLLLILLGYMNLYVNMPEPYTCSANHPLIEIAIPIIITLPLMYTFIIISIDPNTGL